jgi:hypothetical protein
MKFCHATLASFGTVALLRIEVILTSFAAQNLAIFGDLETL